MVKKIFLLSIIMVFSLYSRSFNFEVVPKVEKRISPNSKNEILSFYQAIKDARKAVVNISIKKRVSGNRNFNYLFNDPFFKQFRDFFGNPTLPQKERLEKSLGSGVIISRDGYIVTNNHVVQNADEITVTLPDDKTEYKAKIIGRDAGSDLAVVKIDKNNLTPIKFSRISDVKVGDIVFAIGNPFGVGESVTQGIVSALNKNRMGINRYENFIQTDASINPGNSGGALVDSRGALIGINSAILTRSGGNHGIGFAIPVDMVKNIVEKLIKDGKVTRGYMGVTISDVTKEYEKFYKQRDGAIVISVQKDSAAEKYGIKRGDLIYEVNGKKVKNSYELQNIIASFKPNQKVTIKVKRDNRDKTINIVLGSRDGVTLNSNEKVLGGVYLGELNRENRYKYRISKNVKGVLVTDVEPRSDAERAGFQAGDVIIAIEDIDIRNLNDIKRAIKRYKALPKRVYIDRYGINMLIVIK